jgi:hypothetical protein
MFAAVEEYHGTIKTEDSVYFNPISIPLIKERDWETNGHSFKTTVGTSHSQTNDQLLASVAQSYRRPDSFSHSQTDTV